MFSVRIPGRGWRVVLTHRGRAHWVRISDHSNISTDTAQINKEMVTQCILLSVGTHIIASDLVNDFLKLFVTVLVAIYPYLLEGCILKI